MTEYAPTFDSGKVHSARVWNYWLGGKDHFAVDREFGDKLFRVLPEIIDIAREARAFLGRTVRYLAGEEGIRQFLDIGTGLPTADNTHEVAQRVAPESRIIYVDNDPLVLVHARALLTSAPEGMTAYIDADVRDPDTILAAAAERLDFTRPIALMLMSIMGCVADLDEAYRIVNRLVGALPSGSYLVLRDGTHIVMSEERRQAVFELFDENPEYGYYHLRTREEITRFFDGLTLLEPGVVSCPRWRPDPGGDSYPNEVDEFGGVGRKP